MSGTKVYVGGLQAGIDEREVEDQFARFGKIYKIWIARKPPGFAFIDYEDYRDAEDAVRRMDGFKGWRVEVSRSRGPAPRGGGGPGGRGDMRCFTCGEVGHMARDCRSVPASRGPAGDRYTYSPQRRSPSPPLRYRSRSPLPRRRSPSPAYRRSYSPVREPLPAAGRSRSPVYRSRSPIYRRSRSP